MNPPVPVPPPGPVAAPGSTGGKVTVITNLTGLGLNVLGPAGQTYSDYVSAGTLDSAVLLGPDQQGATFNRFHLEKAASIGSGPIGPDGTPYGRHALYCKAPNVTCNDWYVRMDPSAPVVGSGWSVRYAEFTLVSFDFAGLWFASLFDDDPAHVPGKAWFSNGAVQFASPYGAILYDAQIAYDVQLTNIAFEGAAGVVLTVDAGSAAPSRVAVSGCTMNGRPVTAGMFRGVPAAVLKLS
jgi:hypothetical protein